MTTQNTLLMKLVAAVVLGILLCGALAVSVFAASPTLNPFTAAEVATWSADRSYPSGGVTSVTYAGRDDVMEISINKDARSTLGSFYYTEGVKKEGYTNVHLSADVYLDSAWENIPVRAGLWGVATDDSDVITSYPIIEFSTQRSDNTVGWRVWDVDHWTNLDTPYMWDEWVNLSIKVTDTSIEFYIQDELVGTTALEGSTHFDAVILNAYNYGSEASSYMVHWHAGLTQPTDASMCKDNAWQNYNFKNQGQCVRFVETGKDSR